MNKGERTRKDIIEKAFAMAGNVGLEAVSLGTLAGETGLSKSGLFAHFKSKEALQLSVIEEVIERFTKNVIRPAISAPRGEARIRTYFDRKLDWIAEHRSNGGCLYLALCQEYSHREGPVKDRLIQGQNALMETIARFVRTAINEGQFREDVDPVRFAFELEGIAMAYSHIGKFVQTPKSLDHARVAFKDLIVRSRATV